MLDREQERGRKRRGWGRLVPGSPSRRDAAEKRSFSKRKERKREGNIDKRSKESEIVPNPIFFHAKNLI